MIIALVPASRSEGGLVLAGGLFGPPRTAGRVADFTHVPESNVGSELAPFDFSRELIHVVAKPILVLPARSLPPEPVRLSTDPKRIGENIQLPIAEESMPGIAPVDHGAAARPSSHALARESCSRSAKE
jgi:hypothetical protein